jgi:hypothetical protein
LASEYAPFDGHDEFGAEFFGFRVRFGVLLTIKDDLDDPGAVAQVDEEELAQVAAAVHPAHQDDFFVRV